MYAREELTNQQVSTHLPSLGNSQPIGHKRRVPWVQKLAALAMCRQEYDGKVMCGRQRNEKGGR
jgi:hypothetical protein